MAKIKTISIISSISGKLDKDEDYYIYTDRKTGKMTTRKIGNKRGQPRTPAQQANSARLSAQSRQLKTWFDTNKPSSDKPLGTPEYQNVLEKFKAQNKYGHINHFVRHLIQIGEIQ